MKIKLSITKLSKLFEVKKLAEEDVDTIYNLCKENTFYYEHCPPCVTKESILQDLKALPPKKIDDKKDKYYLGFFEHNKLIAVIDIINAYPFDNYVFIGFFMIDINNQNKGLGSLMIAEICDYLKSVGFKGIRLCWVESNYKAEKFWKQNGFYATGDKVINDSYTTIVAEQLL